MKREHFEIQISALAFEATNAVQGIDRLNGGVALAAGPARIHHPSRAARPGTPVRFRFCNQRFFSNGWPEFRADFKLHHYPSARALTASISSL